jgi:hypothetical protein
MLKGNGISGMGGAHLYGGARPAHMFGGAVPGRLYGGARPAHMFGGALPAKLYGNGLLHGEHAFPEKDIREAEHNYKIMHRLPPHAPLPHAHALNIIDNAVKTHEARGGLFPIAPLIMGAAMPLISKVLPGLLGNVLGGFANQGGQNVANMLTGHGLIPRKVMYNNHPHWVVHGDGIGSWLSGAMGTLRKLLTSSPVRRVGGIALNHVADAFQHALSSKIEDISNKGREYGKSQVDNLTKHIPFVGEAVKGHLHKGVDELVRRGRQTAAEKTNETLGKVRSFANRLQRPSGPGGRPDFAKIMAEKRRGRPMAAPRPTLKAPNAMDHDSEEDDIYEDALTGHGLHRKRAAHTVRSMQCAKKRKMLHHNKQRQLAHLIY